jgi:hypothetical protein
LRVLKPGLTRGDLLEELRSVRPMKIHHHVFEPENLRELVRLLAPRLGWKLEECREKYPPERGDGILVLIRKRG